MTQEKPYGGRLENWHINCHQSVEGYLHDDPNDRFGEGNRIMTSHIVRLDKKNGILETRNTRYSLGVSLKDNLKEMSNDR